MTTVWKHIGPVPFDTWLVRGLALTVVCCVWLFSLPAMYQLPELSGIDQPRVELARLLAEHTLPTLLVAMSAVVLSQLGRRARSRGERLVGTSMRTAAVTVGLLNVFCLLHTVGVLFKPVCEHP